MKNYLNHILYNILVGVAVACVFAYGYYVDFSMHGGALAAAFIVGLGSFIIWFYTIGDIDSIKGYLDSYDYKGEELGIPAYILIFILGSFVCFDLCSSSYSQVAFQFLESDVERNAQKLDDLVAIDKMNSAVSINPEQMEKMREVVGVLESVREISECGISTCATNKEEFFAKYDLVKYEADYEEANEYYRRAFQVLSNAKYSALAKIELNSVGDKTLEDYNNSKIKARLALFLGFFCCLWAYYIEGIPQKTKDIVNKYLKFGKSEGDESEE